MSISLPEVERIAKLSRLNFSEAEKTKLQQELSSILNYVDELKAIESQSGRADLSAGESATTNLMRDDVAILNENPEEFLEQAPARQGQFIKVKSVLD
jgi:aspartyl-tRNA(Asn)/glutamyl-tRNA(Gln) amidotransferase subunit C